MKKNQETLHNDLQGAILIKYMKANLKRDTKLVGQMQCYCKVIIDKKTQITDVDEQGQKKPEWPSNKMSFHIKDSAIIKIEVWNQNSFSQDDFVGDVIINANDEFKNGEFIKVSQKKNIMYNNKIAGELLITYQLLTTYDVLNSYQQNQRYDNRAGNIKVTNLTAQLQAKQFQSFFQNAQMFVQLSVENIQVIETQVCKQTGFDFNWEEEEINLRRQQNYILELKLFEKTILKDKFIGKGQLKFKDLMQTEDHQLNQVNVHIKQNHEIIGDFKLDIQWIPYSEQRSGTIIARPIKAILNRDTELIGEMDPYVQIEIGNQKLKSLTVQQGGKHPTWDPRDELCFKRTDEYQIKIQVYDEDIALHDLIGETTIQMMKIINQNFIEIDHILSYKKKKIGQITIQWLWIPQFEERPGYIGIKSLDNLKLVIPNLGKKFITQGYIRRLDEVSQKIIVFDQQKNKLGETIIPLCRIFEKSDIYNQIAVNLKTNKQFTQTANIEVAWHPDEENRKGNIILKPIEAVLERDTELIGDMDPYVKIQVGDKEWESEVSQGKKPNWASKFEFYRKKEFIVNISIMDNDITYDDLVGQAKFNLSDVFQQKHGTFFDWIELKYEGKYVGKLLMDVKWQPEQFTSLQSPQSTFYNENIQVNQPYNLAFSNKKKIFEKQNNNDEINLILTNTKSQWTGKSEPKQKLDEEKIQKEIDKQQQIDKQLKLQSKQNKNELSLADKLRIQNNAKKGEKTPSIKNNSMISELSKFDQSGSKAPQSQQKENDIQIQNKNNSEQKQNNGSEKVEENQQQIKNLEQIQNKDNNTDNQKTIKPQRKIINESKKDVLAYTSSQVTEDFLDQYDKDKYSQEIKQQMVQEYIDGERQSYDWQQYMAKKYNFVYRQAPGKYIYSDKIQKYDDIILHKNPTTFVEIKEQEFLDNFPGSKQLDWGQIL